MTVDAQITLVKEEFDAWTERLLLNRQERAEIRKQLRECERKLVTLNAQKAAKERRGMAA
jgi:BMFP domain-containing protein YqiC